MESHCEVTSIRSFIHISLLEKRLCIDRERNIENCLFYFLQFYFESYNKVGVVSPTGQQWEHIFLERERKIHITTNINFEISFLRGYNLTAFGELFSCYAGAVLKRFVIDNNHYFECFQALNFDKIVQSKFHLYNNKNKVSFFKSSHNYFMCLVTNYFIHLLRIIVF